MAETQGPGKHRLKLGIPGLDALFPGGLCAGSLIVIIGPPGSGKTLLALQLLMEIHADGEGSAAAPSLFLTTDEDKNVLERESRKILPDIANAPPHIKAYPHIVNVKSFMGKAQDNVYKDIGAMMGVDKETAKNAVPPSPWAAEGHRAAAIKHLMASIADEADGSSISAMMLSSGHRMFQTIAFDGPLNLHELRGKTADERRDALFRLAHRLRELARENDKEPTASILTVEDSNAYEVAGIEEYLADVVIHLRIEAPVKGKRRRLLEVTKARYANPVLGEHSFWIMSDAEVHRRNATNASLGWSKATLAQTIRRGVVVFPRLRWRAHVHDKEDEMKVRLSQLREIVSGIDPSSVAHKMLNDQNIKSFIERLTRQDLAAKDLDAVAEGLKPLFDWIKNLDVSELPSINRTSLSEEDNLPLWTVNAIRDVGKSIRGLLKLMRDQVSDEQCSFFTPGLDALFGAEGDTAGAGGVPMFSSTAVVGGPGTGKSTLAYLFTLAGLLSGHDVIFVSFDVRRQRIVRQVRRFRVESPAGKELKFSEEFARQVMLADSDEPGPRLKLIYEHPFNIDINELMHLLRVEVETLGQRGRHCRIIFDGVSELRRNMPDPFAFNNVIGTLINAAVDWRVTLLMTDEQSTATLDEASDATVARLADNVIGLRHVQVNNASRKCIWIQKVRGRPHSSSVAEMIFWNHGEDSGVTVRKGFEGMSKVLSGNPQPAQIELRLFYENAQERTCNEHFYEDVIERFGPRVRHVPYTLSGARRTYWHRQEGRDIRPDADVTVIALDEPWIQSFVNASRSDGSSLAWWDPRYADVGQKLLVGQLIPAVRRNACEKGVLNHNSRMLALPHYLDLGLLLKRTDYALPEMPTHWLASSENAQDSSFERIVTAAARQLQVPGFAFNMESSETTCCTFIEMCWNFGASHAFLHEQTDTDLRAAIEALQFLARLRWSRVMPFPCTLEHCARAIFCRAWYANVATLASISDGKTWQPVPFLVARRDVPASKLTAREMSRRAAKGARAKLKKMSPLQMEQPPDTHQESDYAEHLSRRHERWEADCETAQKSEAAAVRAERSAKVGISCSGTWYLGVVTATGNSNLGWSVVQEALNPRRVQERAFLGGGLPPTVAFYRDHGDKPIPFLADTSFGRMTRSFLRWTRQRESALGVGLSSPPIDSNANASREMPEMLHSVVMNVLGDARSDPTFEDESTANRFIRGEVVAMFRHLKKLVRQPVDAARSSEKTDDRVEANAEETPA